MRGAQTIRSHGANRRMRDCGSVSVRAARLHLGFLDLNGGGGASAASAWRSRSPDADRARARPGYRRRGLEANAPVSPRDRLGLRPAAADRSIARFPRMRDSARAHSWRSPSPPPRCWMACRSTSAERRAARPQCPRPASAPASSSGRALLDGGRGDSAGRRPSRAAPSPEWRVLLILDPAERNARPARGCSLQSLPLFPAETADLCRRGHAGASGAADGTSRLSAAPSPKCRAIGDHFGAVQGGRYASPEWRPCSRSSPRPASGLWPSSWGPTGFAFAPPRRSGCGCWRPRELAAGPG